MQSAILEIRAGEGGDDAKLFIIDLFSMYMKYCRRHAISFTPLEEHQSLLIAEIKGEIGDLLSFETGVMRLQRVPPTETRGRRHSSTVTVAVLPSTNRSSAIDMKDIEFRYFKGRGPGGQHKNKTMTGVEVTHKPSGAKASCSYGRSQWQNKNAAIRVLSARIEEAMRARQLSDANQLRHKQIGMGGRAEKIRTYNLIYGRVKDVRLKKALYCVDKILDGELDIIYDLLR